MGTGVLESHPLPDNAGVRIYDIGFFNLQQIILQRHYQLDLALLKQRRLAALQEPLSARSGMDSAVDRYSKLFGAIRT